jgi:hypothetical protein
VSLLLKLSPVAAEPDEDEEAWVEPTKAREPEPRVGSGG